MRRILIVTLTACAAVPTAAMAATPSGAFTGTTSQGKQVRLEVKHGRIRAGSTIPYVMTCLHGTLSGTMEPAGRLHHGRYSTQIHNTESVGHGYKAHHNATLRVAMRGPRAHGTLTEQATVLSATGGFVDRCMAAISFTAAR